jgi:hypothetical protein
MRCTVRGLMTTPSSRTTCQTLLPKCRGETARGVRFHDAELKSTGCAKILMVLIEGILLQHQHAEAAHRLSRAV